MSNGALGFRLRYRAFRKKLLSLTPFVRRKRYARLAAQMEDRIRYERQASESLGLAFLTPPPLASAVPYALIKPIERLQFDELCLFVTHATEAKIKQHVLDHISALISAGVAVVLIINTKLEASAVNVPQEMRHVLAGCLVRDNAGFDFAAWAHAYSLIDPKRILSRLYLINDSVVGPLDVQAYRTLLERIRSSSADLIGLTRNPDPHDHLQSYYLVANARLLQSTEFDAFMRSVVNMPHKQNVIDCYEIWLTKIFEDRGFRAVAMFPHLSNNPPPRRNDTLVSWRQLVEMGFPFVKTMVLRERQYAEDVARLVPSQYRESL